MPFIKIWVDIWAKKLDNVIIGIVGNDVCMHIIYLQKQITGGKRYGFYG